MPFLEIHIKGMLDPILTDWFQGFNCQSISSDEFCLTGEVMDDSAVYGVLSSLSSLGLTLISVSITNNLGKQELLK
jgi:hypothetical protein